MSATDHKETHDFGPGPYLSGALLCDRVLTEKDGVKSIIRIVDKIVCTVEAPAPPEVMPPFSHPLLIWVSFKRGSAGGRRRVAVTGVEPSEARTVLFDQVIEFEGELGSGIDVMGNIVLHAEQPGLHWFEVQLDDALITRFPFRVIYQRVVKPAEERSE